MKAVMAGATAVLLDNEAVVVAGGMESMSNVPYALPSAARSGLGYGHKSLDDLVVGDGLTCSTYHVHMGVCGEETAARYAIGRPAQDAYALASYRKAAAATAEGRFTAEIVPLVPPTGKGMPFTTLRAEDIKAASSPTSGRWPKGTIVEDEEFRRVDEAKFASLRPAFLKENGTVTAGNASTLSDGASAVLLLHESSRLLAAGGAPAPLARIVAFADAECAPKDFTIAPSLAIPRVLARAGLTAADISLWEVNEAFSVVALVNAALLGLPAERLNVCGGAVALGHPLGSSGSRIIVTLAHQLARGQFGCAAICNGGGGASAIIIQRL